MTKILFIPLFVAGIMGYGQVKKQVGNFSVEFPYTPTYYNEAPISGYVLDTDNVILIAGVIENIGGFDFQEFMRKSTPWEKELIEDGGVIFQAFLLNDSAGAYREIWTFLKSIKSN